jgi:hypothetical protein
MTNYARDWVCNPNQDNTGRFISKEKENKSMRSMRLSDAAWHALALKSAGQKSRTDLIEEFALDKISSKEAILKALEDFINSQKENYGKNGAQKGKEFSTDSRSWDYFKKFYDLIKNEDSKA